MKKRPFQLCQAYLVKAKIGDIWQLRLVIPHGQGMTWMHGGPFRDRRAFDAECESFSKMLNVPILTAEEWSKILHGE